MKIPVFYRPEMVADSGGYSPSASKPRLVVEDWLAYFHDHIEIISFAPATANTIAVAHERKYVDDVLAMRRDNGFGNRRADVAASLPYTVGSIVAAAKYVASQDAPRPFNGVVAVSPTSGFHHARYADGGAFCTFNGLVVAAQVLLTRGLARRVGIVDFDFHYGNGTDDIIERLYPGAVERNLALFRQYDHGEGVFGWVEESGGWVQAPGKPPFSNLPPIVHYSAGHDSHAAPRFPEFVVRQMGSACDVILYQAGADQHIDDPLGGCYTSEQMRKRDQGIMLLCAVYGFRLLWVLAGGYRRDASGSVEPVISLHRQTMKECVDAFVHGVIPDDWCGFGG
jgi:acetoin utilization deacetylase AcuC-like enzyme